METFGKIECLENDLNPKNKLQKQIERSNSKHGKVEVT